MRPRVLRYSAPVEPLEVITLVLAHARYCLTIEQVWTVEQYLEGKDRRLENGLTGFSTRDIEAVLKAYGWLDT